MVRVPSSEPDIFEQHAPMVTTAVTVAEVAMFPEPDHASEFTAQATYELLRDGDPWAGIEDARGNGSDRQGSVQLADQLPADIHRGRRALCSWPSHQQWFVDAYPAYVGREDRHT